MKYGENGTRKRAEIIVRGRLEGDSVVVEVSDHGVGIAEKDRTHVLDRFVRLDESRSKPGNGLGLSLVASVMTLHSGHINLEDNKPGLRVILRLPLCHQAS